MSVAGLVLAAGRGERLGRGVPKGFVTLGGRPLLVHAIEALAASPAIDRVVPVLPSAADERFAELRAGLRAGGKLADPVTGGAERVDSVRAGLEALPAGVAWVAVHDAARPLVRPEAVSRVVAEARAYGAAILAVPMRDTVKRVRDGRIAETPERAECWAAQTPQVFAVELLREALAKAAADGVVGTDDAQLVERLGVAVRVVEGDPSNLKVTHPADLLAAEAWLRAGGV